MPFNTRTGHFDRVWTFVDQFEQGDDINRSDLDVMANDLAAGITEAAAQTLNYVGEWNPETASFPASRPSGGRIMARDAFVCLGDGTVGGITFEAGEILVALVSDPGQVYATRWLKVPTVTVPAMLDIKEAAETARHEAVAAADLSAGSAAQAALYDGPWLDDIAAVLANTNLSYTSGAGKTVVAVGSYVTTRAEGFAYQVAGSSASDQNMTTAGGVKLYYINRSVITGTDTDKKLVVIAGTVRNLGTAGSIGVPGVPDWQMIVDTNHRSINIGTPFVSGGRVRIPFPETYGKIVSFVAVPDETMARGGFMCGATVGKSFADIEIGLRMTGSVNLSNGAVTPDANFSGSGVITGAIDGAGVVSITHPTLSGIGGRLFNERHVDATSRSARYGVENVNSTLTRIYPRTELNGYVSWSGSAWVYSGYVNGVTVADNGAGLITVTHTTPAAALAAPVVTARDNGSVIAFVDSYANGSFTVKFRDFDGNLVTTPSTDMRFTFSRPASVLSNTAAQGQLNFDLGYAMVDATTTTLNLGNIWIIAVMEKS